MDTSIRNFPLRFGHSVSLSLDLKTIVHCVDETLTWYPKECFPTLLPALPFKIITHYDL